MRRRFTRRERKRMKAITLWCRPSRQWSGTRASITRVYALSAPGGVATFRVDDRPGMASDQTFIPLALRNFEFLERMGELTGRQRTRARWRRQGRR